MGAGATRRPAARAGPHDPQGRSTVGYLYVFATVALTVYGQLAFKWKIDEAGPFPAGTGERAEYLLRLAIDPWIISVFAAALAASVTWGAALKKFDLSFAYPFMSLSFVLVLVLSAAFFAESMTAAKVTGVVLICAGLVIGSQG
jgi:multidrug transporter EmrE-like cation transporter